MSAFVHGLALTVALGLMAQVKSVVPKEVFKLKATAAGLLVAIPCVVMNNVLRRRVIELLAQYKAQHGL